MEEKDKSEGAASAARSLTDTELDSLVASMGAAPLKIILWAEDADTEAYVRKLVEAAPSLISELRGAREWKQALQDSQARLSDSLREARRLLGEARDHLRSEHQCASNEPTDIDAFLGERSDREQSEPPK